jgi:hypothetical protein
MAVFAGPTRDLVDLSIVELDVEEVVDPLESADRIAFELVLSDVAEAVVADPPA